MHKLLTHLVQTLSRFTHDVVLARAGLAAAKCRTERRRADVPIEMFNHCEESGAVLLTVDGWKDVHPSLITLPVDWGYTIPHGMLYPLTPSNSVQLFVRALQETAFSSHLINHR